MAIDLILQEARGMTDDALMEVVHFMRYLKIESLRSTMDGSAEKTAAGKRVIREPGLYAGKIQIADDFDAPIDDFREYM